MEHLRAQVRRAAEEIAKALGEMEFEDRVAAINEARRVIHENSPFRGEPVDLVLWVKGEGVKANGYNPNRVAPLEMDLLRHSIHADGYTQPIVGFLDGGTYEVVDGFHRNRVGKEDAVVRDRLQGYLPVVSVNEGRTGTADRMAATIRHNRARGKHAVTKMSDIVVELSRRKWSDEKIGTELGMEPDEVLRLKQVTGLADLFKDAPFSEAWTVEERE